MKIITTIGIGLSIIGVLALLIVVGFNLLVAILVNERTELVEKKTCGNHLLEFYNNYSNNGGDRANLVIYFDGKLILNDKRKNGIIIGSDRFPADPLIRKDWIVKTYLPNAQGTNLRHEKNIYLEPTKFTKQEFEQFVNCYEKNRTDIDQALLQLENGENYRIARIIYAPIPQHLFESLR